MKIMTVTGPVDVDELGIMLTHEHIIMAFDWPGLWPDVSHRPDLVWKKVAMENLGELRRNYCAIRDNALLKDINEMSNEVERFKNAGGGTIMEMSTYGLYGEPSKLREISKKTGVNVIAGTGFYLEQTFSEDIRNMSVGDMYNIMLRDITEGFPDTGVKAGLIGEVGTSNPISPAEERSLRASAQVQKDLGLAMNVHIGANIELCRKAIRILKEEGADLSKIIFAHFDGGVLDTFKEVTSEGIYTELDCFGNEFYVDNGAYDGDDPWYFGSDGERLEKVRMLVENGLAERIVLSQDVCSKMQTVQYGGYGYVNILENIIPMLEYNGVPKEVTLKMMKENTKRFLTGE